MLGPPTYKCYVNCSCASILTKLVVNLSCMVHYVIKINATKFAFIYNIKHNIDNKNKNRQDRVARIKLANNEYLSSVIKNSFVYVAIDFLLQYLNNVFRIYFPALQVSFTKVKYK